MHGQIEAAAAGMPPASFAIEGAARGDVMHVRVILHRAPPGMQHTKEAGGIWCPAIELRRCRKQASRSASESDSDALLPQNSQSIRTALVQACWVRSDLPFSASAFMISGTSLS
jgi:hypothetical protein